MNEWINSIKIRLLGLDKKAVTSYFQNLDNEYKTKLSGIKRELDERYREKERLLRELELIRNRINNSTNKKTDKKISDELLELAKKRVSNVASFMERMAEAEAQDQIAKAKRNLSSYDEKIKEINEEINNNKRKIDLLLGEVLNIVEGKDEEEKASRKDRKGVTKDRDTSDTNIKVLPYASKKAAQGVIKDIDRLNDIDDIYGEENEDFEEEEEEEELEKEEPVRAQQKAQKTADGLSIKDYFNSNTNKKNFNEKKKEPKIDIYEEDDIDEFLQEEVDRKHSKKEPIVPEKNSFSDMEVSDDKPLNSKIEEVKYSFIIGKLAGEDLTDEDGNVIISKNNVITDDVIGKAEKSGLLSELIINMVLAGLEEGNGGNRI